ncbi:hypothetical protein KP509_28G006500 [Ceratopteris richardii]|uniref:Uncharacterized protein n=1 Tax=Ceratopteris richardii TaxID=49495 RepID=A0A8T2RBS6_CERRI|nr:hypothetical protein KP509_28G006500 [Ceratopteris richardii]
MQGVGIITMYSRRKPSQWTPSRQQDTRRCSGSHVRMEEGMTNKSWQKDGFLLRRWTTVYRGLTLPRNPSQIDEICRILNINLIMTVIFMPPEISYKHRNTKLCS